MIESEFQFFETNSTPSRRRNDVEIDSVRVQNSFFNMPVSGNTIIEQTMQYEKRIYDLEQLIDIAQSFCSTLNFKNLLESIVYICMAQMHVLGAEIFTQDLITSENFILATTEKANTFDIKSSITIPYDSPVTEKLLEVNGPIELKDLRRIIKKDSFEKYEASKRILSIFEGLAPTLIVPLIQRKHLNGILILQERIAIEDDVKYTDYEKNLMMSIASLASVAINNASLLEMSSTDLMTQMRLKFYFFNVLTDRMENLEGYKQKLAVIMFDIDFFKKFNDTYGHECGDYVLVQVAKLIKSNLRENDIASRYGGEEFTVLLENTTKEEAVAVAERIRSVIDNYVFEYNGQKLHVTISGGVSIYTRRNLGLSAAKLVDQADKALYKSKNTGRNKVSFYRKPAEKRLE